MTVETSTNPQPPSWISECLSELVPGDRAATQWKLAELGGGANNRVLHAESAGRNFAVKWYFSSPRDPRDRLRSEWSYSRFAWQHGIRSVPRPIACSPENNLAVYEFIFGRKLKIEEVTDHHVSQAIDFLLESNLHRGSEDASQLPIASEACFSIEQHLDTVDSRVKRLSRLELQSASLAVPFIEDELSRSWHEARMQALELARNAQIAASSEISLAERIVSPSDFGFHNAMLEPTGKLRFLDFEYAGWDDPAKTICDFFCQPAVPVPIEYWSRFVERLSRLVGARLEDRARILFPIYQIKWACIILNPLTAAGRSRRRFSHAVNERDPDWEMRLVERARQFLPDRS